MSSLPMYLHGPEEGIKRRKAFGVPDQRHRHGGRQAGRDGIRVAAENHHRRFEKHAKEIFDEAENRLHAQKAVLVKLLG
ncbi:MAG: hypothetical protein ACLS8R_11490 [Anaeromassilibacillus sp.]